MTWDRTAIEYLGEMHTVDACQFGKPCVVVFSESADEVIAHCHRMGAIWNDDGEDQFIVVLRHDIGPEIYSRDALIRSLARGEAYD